MASGWANDGAVQDQIDSTIEDAVARAEVVCLREKAANFVKNAGNRFQRLVGRQSQVCSYASPASRRKIYITLHLQDIIAEDRKIASFVDSSLPENTAQTVIFTTTFSAKKVAKSAIIHRAGYYPPPKPFIAKIIY